ncbi:MAG: Rab family GTPase [Promethearchaeota archaeon]
MENTIDLKLVLLGEGGVGKTSIVNTFTGNEISSEYLPTIGSRTIKREYELKTMGTVIRVNIWDIGGQRSFNPFNPAFFKNIDVALFVFDLSKPKETLENIKREFYENVHNFSDDFISIIVGNKLDLLIEGSKVKNAINSFLSKNDHLILTSAKTGENVNECFELLIHAFLRKVELMDSDIVLENISNEFLKSIGINEKELNSHLSNITDLDLVLNKYVAKLKVKEESAEEKEVNELKYYNFLKQELENNAVQKNDIMNQFLINISELEKTIKYLQKSFGKSAKDLIDNLKELLLTKKNEFEKEIDLITKLNREEFELVKIISKAKENQIIGQNE